MLKPVDIYFLLLNRTKVVGGRELPSQLNAPPWRIPTNSHTKSSQINAVLSKSMEVQSSHVPDCHGHGDFQVYKSYRAGLYTFIYFSIYFFQIDFSSS